MILRPRSLHKTTTLHNATSLHNASTLLRRPRLANTTPQLCAPPIFQCTRTFTTTPIFSQEAKPTHYDVLGVPPAISQPDLKKRFYVLSKENHPDLHPNSKEHTSRFQQISESYTVLADPDKRHKYDRDVMGSRPTVQKGSFAGSRPATGLSKRRSTFRGPPPSGFGNRGNSSSSESTYAWGPEPQFQQTTDFNSQPVYRTQTMEDERRNRRNAAAQAATEAFDVEGDFWGRLVIITGVIVSGITIGTLLVGVMEATPKAGGMVRGDGTLRRPEAAGKKRDPP